MQQNTIFCENKNVFPFSYIWKSDFGSTRESRIEMKQKKKNLNIFSIAISECILILNFRKKCIFLSKTF